MTSLATIQLRGASEPAAVEDTHALDDGLFVGQLLGVDLRDAVGVLDRVGAGRRLSPDERRTLANGFDEVRDRLALALDPQGRALAGQADPLLASDVIACDASGVLYLRGARINLIDLARTLDAIVRIFGAAEARSLAVDISYG